MTPPAPPSRSGSAERIAALRDALDKLAAK
jgi:hypothetical protein